MKEVYRAADPVQAAILLAVLDAHGIDAVVLGDLAWGGIGELPTDVYPRVMVTRDADFAVARALAQEFDARPPATGPAWRCRCGEVHEEQFATCWRCGAAPDD